MKGYLNKNFSMKDLGEAAYIFGIKIYRDRSRRLIGFSQITYLDKVLKKLKMDQAEKGFLPVSQGVKLSKAQYLCYRVYMRVRFRSCGGQWAHHVG